MKKTGAIFFLLGSFLSAFASKIEPKDSIPKKNNLIFTLGVNSHYGSLNGKPSKYINYKTKTPVFIIGIQARLIKSIKRTYIGGSLSCDFLHFNKFSKVHNPDSIPNNFLYNNNYSYEGIMIIPAIYSAYSFKYKRLEFRPYVQPGIIFDFYIINRHQYSLYNEYWFISSGRVSAISLKLRCGLEIIKKRLIVGINYSYYNFPREPKIVRLDMNSIGLSLGYKF